MSKTKEKKKFPWKELLISFGITCALLGVVIGLTVWYQSSLSGVASVLFEWNTTELIIGNAIAFLIMFLIIFHFVKKPKKKEQQESWKI